MRYEGSQLEARDEASTARLRVVAAASASFVDAFGCTNFSVSGIDELATMRTVPPTMRAARYEPSSVSVRTMRSAPGSETSTSVSVDCDGAYAIIVRASAGSGSAQ